MTGSSGSELLPHPENDVNATSLIAPVQNSTLAAETRSSAVCSLLIGRRDAQEPPLSCALLRTYISFSTFKESYINIKNADRCEGSVKVQAVKVNPPQWW